MENGKRRAFEAIIDPEEDMFWDIFKGKNWYSLTYL